MDVLGLEMTRGAVPRPNDGAPLKRIGRFGWLWTKLDLEILQADGFVNDEDIMGI